MLREGYTWEFLPMSICSLIDSRAIFKHYPVEWCLEHAMSWNVRGVHDLISLFYMGKLSV